jgi:hypothetical protein
MQGYQKLTSLPHVPDSLLIYDFSRTDYNITSDIHLTRGDQCFQAGRYLRNPITQDLADWLRQNVLAEWADAGFSCIFGPCLGPHIDQTRLYTLQYVVQTGGSAVDTVFYEAANERLKIGQRLKFSCYDDLTAVESFRATDHSWWILNGREIHSVENIQTQRIALQIGLMRDPVEKGLLLS